MNTNILGHKWQKSTKLCYQFMTNGKGSLLTLLQKYWAGRGIIFVQRTLHKKHAIAQTVLNCKNRNYPLLLPTLFGRAHPHRLQAGLLTCSSQALVSMTQADIPCAQKYPHLLLWWSLHYYQMNKPSLFCHMMNHSWPGCPLHPSCLWTKWQLGEAILEPSSPQTEKPPRGP